MRVHRVAGVLVAAAAGGLLASCGTQPPSQPSTQRPPVASHGPVTTQPQHNQADIVFLQNMIPHHTRAIAMAQMAGNQTTSPQVKDLATRVKNEQSQQAQQMSNLLSSWGASTIGPTTETDQIPGVINGAGFDRMILQVMIVHHQDAVTMARTELTQGGDPTTRNLAQQIISTQQAEINEMKTLLQVI